MSAGNAGKAKMHPLKRLMLICTAWAVLLLAGMTGIVYFGSRDSNSRENVIEYCAERGPVTPAWRPQLKALGLEDKSSTVIRPYCHCMWDDALSSMGTRDIKKFFNGSLDDQVRYLGGEKAMAAKHNRCLQEIKTQYGK